MNPNKKNPKKPIEYICEKCDFITCNKKDYSRHIQTDKHIILMDPNVKNPLNHFFVCNCGKSYKHSSSLCAHKKKCNILTKNEEIDEDINESINEPIETIDEDNKEIDYQNNEIHELKEFMKYLMKENSEMKTMMMEVIKNGTHNTTITSNSHNKAFNLNFFLNETCKDAMNIMDFVESIQFQLSDLERVGEVGYIEGISNIIVKNLKELDITQRPVHCTDKKRETLYVKDDNKWEKDDENTKMHKMIRKVQDKNFRLIKKFKEKYPDYHKPSSKQSDVYNNIIIESMGGRGDNDYEKEEKIIKKVSKEILVEK
jgi:hypothetical protein